MFENDRKDTASKAVTSIRHQNDIEKSTWKIHWYFFDFERRIHVEISTSNRCYNFHVDLPFKIDETLTNFPRGISTSNRWRIDEDVSIGKIKYQKFTNLLDTATGNVPRFITQQWTEFHNQSWGTYDVKKKKKNHLKHQC